MKEKYHGIDLHNRYIKNSYIFRAVGRSTPPGTEDAGSRWTTRLSGKRIKDG